MTELLVWDAESFLLSDDLAGSLVSVTGATSSSSLSGCSISKLFAFVSGSRSAAGGGEDLADDWVGVAGDSTLSATGTL